MIAAVASGLLVIIMVLTAAASSSAQAPSDPPLKQLQSGVPISEIQCADGKMLVQKNLRPACVTGATAEALVQRGWAVVQVAAPPPPPPTSAAAAAPHPLPPEAAPPSRQNDPKTDMTAHLNDTADTVPADIEPHA